MTIAISGLRVKSERYFCIGLILALYWPHVQGNSEGGKSTKPKKYEATLLNLQKNPLRGGWVS
ncbi:hypothetical protein BOTCAL_0273g00050 [Botryotinia calthae]|uniref:Uncharacterized protein n=1 Tax=Botryotinia calthae TaxID=38488 RepID=A0A4Y8CVJ7_9HELO|nr:hypothetical protein BOTCAL_0273g00050 [Botryotinia calthae]